MIDVSDLVRACRIQRGMNTRELARKAGVSPTTVSYIENGHHSPRVDMLEWLVNACGFNLHITISERKGDE